MRSARNNDHPRRYCNQVAIREGQVATQPRQRARNGTISDPATSRQPSHAKSAKSAKLAANWRNQAAQNGVIAITTVIRNRT